MLKYYLALLTNCYFFMKHYELANAMIWLFKLFICYYFVTSVNFDSYVE
jgi:hypothetical protein